MKKKIYFYLDTFLFGLVMSIAILVFMRCCTAFCKTAIKEAIEESKQDTIVVKEIKVTEGK